MIALIVCSNVLIRSIKMKRYVTNKNPNKKQQKEQNDRQRTLWSCSPITKVVGRKDKYNRKDKSWQKSLEY